MGEALGAELSLGTLATLSTWLLGPGNPLTWKTPGTGLEETLPGNRQDGGSARAGLEHSRLADI